MIPLPHLAASLPLAAWAAAVAVLDIRQRRIPNLLLVLLLVPAVLAVAINGRGLLGVDAMASATGLLVGGLPLLPGYAQGQMGAGDVKFSACLGWLLGPGATLEMLLWSAVMLGLVSGAMLAYAGSAVRQRRIPAAPMLAGAFGVQLACGRLLSF